MEDHAVSITPSAAERRTVGTKSTAEQHTILMPRKSTPSAPTSELSRLVLDSNQVRMAVMTRGMIQRASQVPRQPQSGPSSQASESVTSRRQSQRTASQATRSARSSPATGSERGQPVEDPNSSDEDDDDDDDDDDDGESDDGNDGDDDSDNDNDELQVSDVFSAFAPGDLLAIEPIATGNGPESIIHSNITRACIEEAHANPDFLQRLRQATHAQGRQTWGDALCARIQRRFGRIANDFRANEIDPNNLSDVITTADKLDSLEKAIARVFLTPRYRNNLTADQRGNLVMILLAMLRFVFINNVNRPVPRQYAHVEPEHTNLYLYLICREDIITPFVVQTLTVVRRRFGLQNSQSMSLADVLTSFDNRHFEMGPQGRRSIPGQPVPSRSFTGAALSLLEELRRPAI